MSRLKSLRFLPGESVVRVPPGTTVFEGATWAGIAVDSTCGARGTCHKCRVRLPGGAMPATPADTRAFTADELATGWRLACRAVVTNDEAEEIEIDVPPFSTSPKAALVGRGRHVVLAPSLQLRRLDLEPPTLRDQVSDLERVRRGIPDLELEVPDDVLRALPHALRAERFGATAVVVSNHLVAVTPGDHPGPAYGLAVDLGTTTVVAALVDVATGATVGLSSTLNEQRHRGADVISRISHAVTGPSALEELRDSAIATIGRLVEETCGQAAAGPESVYHVVIVGNTTMLHLLLGVNPRALAVSPFTPAFREPVDVSARRLGLPVHPEGRVQTFPLLGSYAGADTIAGILATGIGRQPRVSLLIDIGTNGEVVLSDGERIVAAAAPAGPAFEGGEISCGMQAVEGAIESVELGDDVVLQVIGGGAPRGLCGSGLTDAVAQLLEAGLLDTSGRLRTADSVAGHPLADRLVERDGVAGFRLADGIELSQLDVRAVQSAKGAIACGVQILMQELGVEPDDLDEVLLAGSFGTYVNPVSARAIGLIPQVPLDRVSSVGNTALEGARMALLSFREHRIAEALADRVEYVELAARPEFSRAFMAALAFPSRAT